METFKGKKVFFGSAINFETSLRKGREIMSHRMSIQWRNFREKCPTFEKVVEGWSMCENLIGKTTDADVVEASPVT